jgi:Holliday junction DNA helicase RuvA
MISAVRGLVIRRQDDGRVHLRLDQGGLPGALTLELTMPLAEAGALSAGDEAELAAYLHFSSKADLIRLYGFASQQSRGLFVLLIGASGIGPAVALALLDLGAANLAAAIRQGDERSLTQASGVGPKLAKKIILELSDKIAREFADLSSLPAHKAAGGSGLPRQIEDALSAVVALGFPRQRAEQALESVRVDYGGDETIVLIRRMLAVLAAG